MQLEYHKHRPKRVSMSSFSPKFTEISAIEEELSKLVGHWMIRVPYGSVVEWTGKTFRNNGNYVRVPKESIEYLPEKTCVGVVSNCENDRLFQFHAFDIQSKDTFEVRQDELYGMWRGSLSYHMKLILADKVESVGWILSKIPNFTGVINEFWFFKENSLFNDEITVLSLEKKNV